MKRYFTVSGILFLLGCGLSGRNNTMNPYENKAGINPVSLAMADTRNYTLVEWKDSIQDFGTVTEGDTVHLNYTFRNTGSTPLFITGVKTECGCTVTDFPRNIIQPQESGIIKAVFNTTAKQGFVRKSIHVSSNTRNNSVHTLTYFGQVNKQHH